MSLPDRFGRYQVLDVLGQGAMGLVYKAVDPLIERAVAIKVVQSGPGLSGPELEQMRARFEQEFRSAGALSHAHIVTVFDVGKEGDLYYIAMEYVEGRSLDRILAERRVLSLAEVGAMACELAGALDYAHSQGVVHRDVKPANVLVDAEGSAKITDFGLAKLEATTLTRTGALVGTPAYMSPEQVAGHTVTGKTDQFSLAILLYQMLTGERPFTGDSPSTIMYRIAHEEPLPARQLNKSLPSAVDDVLLRALQKDVVARFPTCLEMAEGLRRALAGGATVAARSSPPAQPSGHAPPSGSLHEEPLRAGAPQSSTPAAVPAGPGGSQASFPPPSPPHATASPPPSDVSQSVAPPLPRWLLTLAIVLPSVALLALLAWFVSGGTATNPRSGGPEQSAAGEVTESSVGGVDNAAGRADPAAPGEPPAGVRAPPGRAGRLGERLEALEGVPQQLQQLMDSGEIRSGRLVIESPFAVGLRLVPASRLQNMSPQLRERLQNANVEDRRRLMAGFFIAQSGAHDIELPAGNWRLAMIAPQVFFYHEEQIILRPGQTLRLDERVPSRLVRVRIVSDPAGARVREGNMPAVPTPFDGLVVAGDHRFEFIWGDTQAIVPATIERDGQEVVGRRQP